MFWTDHGDAANTPGATPIIELDESEGFEAAAGRTEALYAYGDGIAPILTECQDIAGPAALAGPLAEWSEFIDAAAAAGAALEAVEASRSRLSAYQSMMPDANHDHRNGWEFFGRLTAVAGLTAATSAHIQVVADEAQNPDRRRAHGQAVLMTAVNLAHQRETLPAHVPNDVPGATMKNRRLLNHIRRSADAALQQFEDCAASRLAAAGLEMTPAIRDHSEHRRVADQTALEMFRRNHAFAIAGLPEPQRGTMVVYRHQGRTLAKRAEEPYLAGYDPAAAEVHGQAMLTMSCHGAEDAAAADQGLDINLAQDGLLTALKAEYGLHDLEPSALELLIQTIERADGYRSERAQVIRRLAGPSDALYGWLTRMVGPRRSNVTPAQARAMIQAGRDTLTPETILRQLAARMGQSDASPQLPDTATDPDKVLKTVAEISPDPRLANAVARSLSVRRDDPC